MGLFGTSSKSAIKNAQQEPLQNAPYPIGVTPNYIANNETVLKLREKTWSLSGDSFDITTAQDNLPVFKCTGSVMSLHSKKLFTDSNKNPLLTISKKLLTIHTIFEVYRGDATDELLFTVRSHWNPLGGAKMTISFTNVHDKQPIELKINGDFFDRNAKITLGEGGQVVGRIDRNFATLGEVFGDQQTYFLRVAPGVDGLMLAAVCVCLDEKANDK
ncbi:tubby C-terminal-like domain-containing protein [Peziza echinospora]|nr:tubby C-terminal-like domain-containing protein [Peziza echinospora]